MSRPGVSGDDMPISASPSQPESAVQDAALTALLAGADLPADGAAGLRPVADVLAALRAGPADGELAGEMTVLAQFRQQFGVSAQPHRSRRRRTRMLPALLSAKAAVIAAFAAISFGGIATAAYTGALPAPIQRIAHTILGAPASGGQATGEHPPVGGGHHGTRPPAAHRKGQQTLAWLCSRYEQSPGHGGGAGRSAAFRALVQAAGGAGKVAGFCASVTHGKAGPQPPGHSHGKPGSHGNESGNGQGNGKGSGNGNGQGSGNGNGQGNGSGNGQGNGNGTGNSQGSGQGSGHGHGNGIGNGNGHGHRHGGSGHHGHHHSVGLIPGKTPRYQYQLQP
jgi:hypothetical protein